MKIVMWYLGLWVRKIFWPNWSLKSEWRDDKGWIRIAFHDEDYPDEPKFYREITLGRRRLDVTKDSFRTKQYLYEPMQVMGNWQLIGVKLHSGKVVDIKIVIIDAHKKNDTEEIKELMKLKRQFPSIEINELPPLTEADRMEALKVVKNHDFLA